MTRNLSIHLTQDMNHQHVYSQESTFASLWFLDEPKSFKTFSLLLFCSLTLLLMYYSQIGPCSCTIILRWRDRVRQAQKLPPIDFYFVKSLQQAELNQNQTWEPGTQCRSPTHVEGTLQLEPKLLPPRIQISRQLKPEATARNQARVLQCRLWAVQPIG